MPKPSQPNASADSFAAKAARQAREAAALRENLRKRKQQARSREESCPDESRDPVGSGTAPPDPDGS
jgi:hypothetical protein